MTHVVLLSAGQGRRLSPLTDSRPKCLVPVGGRSILDWQLEAIFAAGLRDVTVVTGFRSESVETAVKLNPLPLRVQTRFNPFYTVADNISSCWATRDLIDGDTVLINGDVLFDPRILMKLLDGSDQPVTVTIDHKESYDSDDMKVVLDGPRLKRIGKTLAGVVDGESIGMLRFRGDGGSRFIARMDAMLRDPAALGLWYLSVVDELAQSGIVGAISVVGLPWAEVDFPSDLPAAAERVAAFDWPTLSAVASPEAQVEIGS